MAATKTKLDAGDYLQALENIQKEIRVCLITHEMNKVLLKYVEKKLKKWQLPTMKKEEEKSLNLSEKQEIKA